MTSYINKFFPLLSIALSFKVVGLLNELDNKNKEFSELTKTVQLNTDLEVDRISRENHLKYVSISN